MVNFKGKLQGDSPRNHCTGWVEPGDLLGPFGWLPHVCLAPAGGHEAGDGHQVSVLWVCWVPDLGDAYFPGHLT